MIKHILLTIAVTSLITLTVVLPYENGVDVLGAGKWLGIISKAPTETIQNNSQVLVMIKTPEGLSESNLPYREDEDDPIPLPDVSVFKAHDKSAGIKHIEITLAPNHQSEFKVIAKQGEVILFDWKSNSAGVYSDFHGHLPDADNIWVRYKEEDEITHDAGSLIIPFDGEHGWYWLNFNDHEVTLSLNIYGYFDDIVDYGVSEML